MGQSMEERARRAWEELTIRDNFIFQRVMQNKNLCKRLIERILQIKIRELTYPYTEKTIDLRLDSKAIRLDVYVEDEAGTVYNIEMQTTKGHDGELVRRTRYYQAMIDMDLLGKGVYYDELRQTYIIFVCTFDLFGLEQRVYTFRSTCVEVPTLALGDGATRIFLNAKGLKGTVDADIERFLHYVDGKAAKGGFAEALAKEVERVKYQDETRREFMTLYMEYQRHRRDGLEEGRRKGLREGHSKGLREGHSKGLREGHSKGLREGHSKGLREGQEQATLQNLRDLMTSLSLSPEQAVDALRIPSAEQPHYLQQLSYAEGARQRE